VVGTAAIKARFEALAPFLGECDRRLWAASKAYAAGRGSILAVSAVTGIARSTIGRGLAELGYGKDQCPGRIRRPGGGRRPKTTTEPGLLEALAELVQSATRGRPGGRVAIGQSERTLPGPCFGRARLQRQPEAGRAAAAPLGL